MEAEQRLKKRDEKHENNSLPFRCSRTGATVEGPWTMGSTIRLLCNRSIGLSLFFSFSTL